MTSLLELQAQADFVALALSRKRSWAPAKEVDRQAIAQANVCFQFTNELSRRLRRLPTFSWGPVANFALGPKVEMDLEGLLGEVTDLFHRVPPSPWLFSAHLLEVPESPQVWEAVRSTVPGCPVRAVKDYHIGVDEVLVRFDVLYLRA